MVLRWNQKDFKTIICASVIFTYYYVIPLFYFKPGFLLWLTQHISARIVGIAGASASGKSLIASTLYRELRAQVGDHNIGVIPEDCYYRDQSDLTMEERYKVNYDHPNSMDHALLYQHWSHCELKAGNAIELPQL